MSQTTNDLNEATLTASDETLCTNSFAIFADHHKTNLKALTFMVEVSSYADLLTHWLKQIAPHVAEVDVTELMEKFDKTPTTGKILEAMMFAEHFVENLLIRSVDNFHIFLVDSIKSCCLVQPNILKTEEKIALGDIINFATRDEILNHIIDAKINNLSFSGLKGLSEFFEKRMSIDLASDKGCAHHLSASIEYRNAHVHNRGKASVVTVGNLKDTQFALEKGDRIYPDPGTLNRLSNNLFLIAKSLDERLSEKFDLKIQKFETWRPPTIDKEFKLGLRS